MKYLIFLILKIVEITAVVFVPYYAGRVFEFAVLWSCPEVGPCPRAFLWPVGALALVLAFFVIVAGIALTKLNWKLAEKYWLKIKAVLNEKHRMS